MTIEGKKRRGLASMSPERRREIAAMGGAAIPREKRTFSTNRVLAVEAGRKGGANVPPEKRSFSTDRTLAKVSGRMGGRANRGKQKVVGEHNG